MSQLSKQALLPCVKDCRALSNDEVSDLVAQLCEWRVIEKEGVQQLLREYRFRNFVDALAFANHVGELAEQENHHPCVCIEWGKASVSWWTHSLSGLFNNDFIMAARCDELYTSRVAD